MTYAARPPVGKLGSWLALGGAVFALSLLFPPTSDDWRRIAFADRTPLGLLGDASSSYQNHNGRVLGNLLSFVLIEPLWLRAAVKAVVVVALVAIMQVVVGRRSAWLALLCFAGIFLVPASVFRESYVWSAGFFNYVPPMVGLLHLVAVLGRRWPSMERQRPWSVGAGCATVGLATCLFVEHVTVAVLALALAGLAFETAFRRRSASVLGWAVGAIAGSAIMFGSPGMGEVAAQQGSYFSYAASARQLMAMGQVNYSTVTTSFVLSNPILLALITAACVGVGLRGRGTAGARSVTDWALVLGSLAVAGFAVLSRTMAADSLRCARPGDCHGGLLLGDLAALVMLLGLLILAGHRYLAKDDRAVWFLLIAATGLMLGPLLVVTPIGPRNVFGPTVTLVTLGVLLTLRAVEGVRPVRLRLVRVAIGTVVLAGLAGQLVVQSANFATARERVRLMEAAVHSRHHSVKLPEFPFSDWVNSNRDKKMSNRYYIDKPGDIKISLRESDAP